MSPMGDIPNERPRVQQSYPNNKSRRHDNLRVHRPFSNTADCNKLAQTSNKGYQHGASTVLQHRRLQRDLPIEYAMPGRGASTVLQHRRLQPEELRRMVIQSLRCIDRSPTPPTATEDLQQVCVASVSETRDIAAWSPPTLCRSSQNYGVTGHKRGLRQVPPPYGFNTHNTAPRISL